MQVLEKILEEIEEVEKKFVVGHEVLFALGATGLASEIEKIIRSHMEEYKDTNAISNDGWISVEERLPEDREEIEVTIEEKTDEDGGKRYYTVRSWLQDGRWIIRQNPYEPRVIAWQPLPEPYKPKRDISASENIL